MKTYKVTVNSYNTQRWYNSEDQLHREDAPAVIHIDGTKEYYLNGQLHREAEFIAHTQKPDCSGQIVTVDGIEYTLEKKS